jgi:hypothetical protein
MVMKGAQQVKVRLLVRVRSTSSNDLDILDSYEQREFKSFVP